MSQLRKKKTMNEVVKKEDTKVSQTTNKREDWWGSLELNTDNKKLFSVENYRDRIMENLYIGSKAIYLVARDLFQAKAELDETTYAKLLEELPISESTERKYRQIGGSVFLDKLFDNGQLPMGWTVCYSLRSQPKHLQNKIESKIYPEITQSELNKLIKEANGTLPKSSVIPNTEYTMVQIAVDKTKMSSVDQVNEVLKCLNDFRKLDYVVIKKDEDKINSFKTKLKNDSKKNAESDTLTSEDAKKVA